MEVQGKGAIWADSHYLPFPCHLAYLLIFCQIRWIKFPSERYLVTPALLAEVASAWINFGTALLERAGLKFTAL
jgi:hypothetical protein